MVLCLLIAAAAAADGDAFRRKQQAQEKARGLAGELVSAVLDIQLRQLEENGLKGLPIYRDIASMKGNIGELIKDEMEEIVQLLVEAQEGTQAERLAKFNAARGKIREVVVQLMAERQKLYRRMQIAKLAAEVRAADRPGNQGLQHHQVAARAEAGRPRAAGPGDDRGPGRRAEALLSARRDAGRRQHLGRADRRRRVRRPADSRRRPRSIRS